MSIYDRLHDRIIDVFNIDLSVKKRSLQELYILRSLTLSSIIIFTILVVLGSIAFYLNVFDKPTIQIVGISEKSNQTKQKD